MGCIKSKQVGVLEPASGRAEPASNDPNARINPPYPPEEQTEQSTSNDPYIPVSLPHTERDDMLPSPEELTETSSSNDPYIPVSLPNTEKEAMLPSHEDLTEKSTSNDPCIPVSPSNMEQEDMLPSLEELAEESKSNDLCIPVSHPNMVKEDMLPSPEEPIEESKCNDPYIPVSPPNMKEDALPSPEEPAAEPTSNDPYIPINPNKMSNKRPARSPEDSTGKTINPPLKPPNTKKIDAVHSPEAFAAIDAHTLKATANVRTSVTSLAQYLVKPASNDMEKVRAFYRWIADNISYDVSGLFDGNSGPQDAETVLKRGSSVCEGYASLFQSLCDECKIPCKMVSGFSKAFGYDPESPFTLNTRTDHAWNIVYVQGEWRPIECTWGAGYLTTNCMYEKRFEEFYFLTDPEHFVIKHFPYVDKNVETSIPLQLLKNPYTLEKFNNALCPTVEGTKWGFECTSHKTQVITVNKECEISFKTQNVKLSGLMCNLKEKNTQQEYTQYVLLRKQGDRYTAKITPPKESKYNFGIYGKPDSSSGPTHNEMITFVLRCQSVAKDIRPYPDKKGCWGASEDAIQYGFTNDILGKDVITTSTGEAELRLKTSQLVTILLGLAQAESNHDLDRYVFGFYEGNTLVIKARVSHVGFYKLTLFGQRPENSESSSLDDVADFLIESKKAVSNVLPFPMAYTAAQKYGCQLHEPLSGDLPANQDIRFKLSSDSLTKLMVNKQVKEKEAKEFDFTFRTPSAGEKLKVFGTSGDSSRFNGLYIYNIV